MTHWTPAANQVWEAYQEQNRARIIATGGDPDEVFGDLRRHIEAELEAQKLPVVTEDDLRRAIQKLGPLPTQEAEPPKLDAVESKPLFPTKTALGFLFFFGVVLPAGTLVFELITGSCTSDLFDPIPTIFHSLLVAWVAVANGITWGFLMAKKPAPKWVWFSNATAMGISLFYSLALLPIAPFALIGVLFCGLGLIPLAPECALFCAWIMRTRMVRQEKLLNRRFSRPQWWSGFATGFLVLILLLLQGSFTHYWMIKALDRENPSVNAVQNLRQYGDRDILLRACYGQNRPSWFSLFADAKTVSPESVRPLYYRVTGEPFNSVPPPLSKSRGTGRWADENFEWDNAVGGEVVAGCVKKLSLAQSRMDGTVNASEGWAYMQWTLEFNNDSGLQREARAQIQLPPGAVVSRVTLWINGEEREAAFGTRSQVRQAYQQVAVARRRDPVLVTTSGPDRVLVQCFPVPPNGGRMKIRLGITAPLGILGEQSSAFHLPCLIERNFSIPKTLDHNLWLQSPTSFRSQLKNLSRLTGDDKNSIHGTLSDAELLSTNAVIQLDAIPQSGSILAADPKSPGRVIEQTLKALPGEKPTRIAIMLDGSRAMTPHYPIIANFLTTLPTTTETRIWFQQDDLRMLYDSTLNPSASSLLQSLQGEGGQYNLPGLLHAWDWAAEKHGGVILWIHADQPVELENLFALQQRLSWQSGSAAPLIIDIPVQHGPNCIAQELGNSPSVTSLPRYGSLREDLERLSSEWFGKTRWTYVRGESSATSVTPSGSEHIVRLWALQKTRELLRGHKVKEAAELASSHQLVTPVSGAVVLETKAQYDEFSLTPADAATVPSVPEPSTLILAAMAVIGFVLMRRRMLRKAAR
jgi:hypothetical protein